MTDTPAENATAAPATLPAPAVSSAPSQADTLAALQQENQHLKARIDELVADSAARADDQRLAQAEQANAQLRQRLTGLALTQGLAQAAANVGLSDQAAGVYAHRFRCTLDDEGRPRIEPNPTEFLLRELQDNPLLKQSAQREASQRQARAVVSGACDVAQADPVELLAALDRDPSRKAQFISRHGSAAFIDLAAKARVKRAGHSRIGSSPR